MAFSSNNTLTLTTNQSSARNSLVTAQANLQSKFNLSYASAADTLILVSALPSGGGTNTHDLFGGTQDNPIGDNVTFTALDWIFIKNSGASKMDFRFSDSSAIPIVEVTGANRNIQIFPSNSLFLDFSGSAMPVTTTRGKIFIDGQSAESYQLMIVGR